MINSEIYLTVINY